MSMYVMQSVAIHPHCPAHCSTHWAEELQQASSIAQHTHTHTRCILTSYWNQTWVTYTDTGDSESLAISTGCCSYDKPLSVKQTIQALLYTTVSWQCIPKTGHTHWERMGRCCDRNNWYIVSTGCCTITAVTCRANRMWAMNIIKRQACTWCAHAHATLSLPAVLEGTCMYGMSMELVTPNWFELSKT